MTQNFSRRRLFLNVALVLIASTGGAAAWMLMPPPSGLDLSRAKLTEQGVYEAAIAPKGDEPKVGRMHAWTLSLRTATGKPVPGAMIAIDGGMPQHGHGLPTAPKVTQDYGDGTYLIEGMKFNMSGWWTLDVHVAATAGTDTATFNLVLER
jgi:YtkA-like